MSWLLSILIVVLVLDALRLRARLSGLSVVPGPEAAGSEGFGCVIAKLAAPLPRDVLRRATSYCHGQRLDMLDLVPRELSALRALALASLVDPRSYRRDRLATGYSAAHALVISDALSARAGIHTAITVDTIELAQLAARAKAYACTSSDLAVVAGLPVAPEDGSLRLRAIRELFGSFTPFMLGIQLALYTVLVIGVALPQTRGLGLAALAAFQLQPLLAIAGTPLRPRDLWLVTLIRLPWELAVWLRTVAASTRHEPNDAVTQRRPVYDALLLDTGRFLEPRREHCPVCEGAKLAVHLRSGDLLQHKPGTFTLERCHDCGHIFQNPRLSLEGLDFYYRDFYDGLGEKRLAFIFGSQSASYLDRARMVQQHVAPERWLDVGAGHGHFCCVARDLLPATRFDGIDLSESIEEAARRGWVQTGHRGLFPQRASELAGSYDVVSMHHYLEHTLDPAAEIAAAGIALGGRGHLLIELPDPQSRLGSLLGRYWMPWFQPQHQHLLSATNLERLLQQHDFTPLEWHRKEAHQHVDFLMAVMLWLGRLAPPRELPWRPRPTPLQRALRVVVWTLGAPLIALAGALDRLLDPVVRRLGASNTYRVLAQKNG